MAWLNQRVQGRGCCTSWWRRCWWCRRCRGRWCCGGSSRWCDIKPWELNVLMELEFELGEERLGLGIPLLNTAERSNSQQQARDDRSSYQRRRETVSLVFRKCDDSRYCSVVEYPTPGDGHRRLDAVSTLAEWCVCRRRRRVNGVSTPPVRWHDASYRLDDVRLHAIVGVLPVFKVVVNIIHLQQSPAEALLFYPVFTHRQDAGGQKHRRKRNLEESLKHTATTLKEQCTRKHGMKLFISMKSNGEDLLKVKNSELWRKYDHSKRWSGESPAGCQSPANDITATSLVQSLHHKIGIIMAMGGEKHNTSKILTARSLLALYSFGFWPADQHHWAPQRVKIFYTKRKPFAMSGSAFEEQAFTFKSPL